MEKHAIGAFKTPRYAYLQVNHSVTLIVNMLQCCYSTSCLSK